MKIAKSRHAARVQATAIRASADDIVVAGTLALASLLERVANDVDWPWLARGFAVATGKLRPAKRRQEAALIAVALGPAFGASAAGGIAAELALQRFLAMLAAMRLRRQPDWRPRTRLIGREQLDAALARGRGAVLWIPPFVHAPVLGKVALWDAGHRVIHLSRPVHPFSGTRLALRRLNPVWTAVEEHFLAERVVIPEDGSPAGVLRRLAKALAGGGVVSVTMSGAGGRSCTVPCLAGQLRLAWGAPYLALRAAAPLLLVTTVLRGDTVETRIHPPLLGEEALDDAATVEAVARGVREFLEPSLREAPGQFAWRDLFPPPGGVGGEA